MKKGYFVHLEEKTKEERDFARVLYTGEGSQLVLMSLTPGEEIGLEVHDKNDQFFRFESGEGQVVVNETTYDVKDGDAVIVPMGAQHNVTNTSTTKRLTFYTLYSPAHHKDGSVHPTKAHAKEHEEEFDGTTSE